MCVLVYRRRLTYCKHHGGFFFFSYTYHHARFRAGPALQRSERHRQDLRTSCAPHISSTSAIRLTDDLELDHRLPCAPTTNSTGTRCAACRVEEPCWLLDDRRGQLDTVSWTRFRFFESIVLSTYHTYRCEKYGMRWNRAVVAHPPYDPSALLQPADRNMRLPRPVAATQQHIGVGIHFHNRRKWCYACWDHCEFAKSVRVVVWEHNQCQLCCHKKNLFQIAFFELSVFWNSLFTHFSFKKFCLRSRRKYYINRGQSCHQ